MRPLSRQGALVPAKADGEIDGCYYATSKIKELQSWSVRRHADPEWRL
jgi:hypothetical protein